MKLSKERAAAMRAELIAGEANHFAHVSPIITELRATGIESREIARRLNERGIPASQFRPESFMGGPWTRYRVDRFIKKIDGVE